MDEDLTEYDGRDDGVASLVIGLMAHNAADAAHTTQMLVDIADRNAIVQAEAFCGFYDAIAQALPPHIRTVVVDEILVEYGGEYALAADILAREGQPRRYAPSWGQP